MNESKGRLVPIVGGTLSALVLVTCALLPTLVGDDHETWMWLIRLSFFATLAFCGWIVAAFATASRVWLIALGAVATWGILLGSATTLKNYNDYSFHSSQVVSGRERTERMRTETDKDGMRRSQKDIDRAREDEERTQTNVDRAKRGLTFSVPILLVGLVAAAKTVLLVRRGPGSS